MTTSLMNSISERFDESHTLSSLKGGDSVTAIGFLPFWKDNPYHEQLAKGLSQAGATVRAIPKNRWFIFDCLRNAKLDALHVHTPYVFFMSRKLWVTYAKMFHFLAQLLVLRCTSERTDIHLSYSLVFRMTLLRTVIMPGFP